MKRVVASAAMALVCLCGFSVADAANDLAETKSKLEVTVSDYQKALAISDAAQRGAAFRKVEIALASLLSEPADSKGLFSSDLYVNWGNAAIQINELGTAVLAFRKALQIDPWNTRAKKNLEYVRAQLPDWTKDDGAESVSLNRLFFWKLFLPQSTIQVIAASMFLLGAALLAASIFWNLIPLRYLAVLPFAVWILLLLSTFSYSGDQENGGIVFVAEETMCRTADSKNSSFSFETPIPAGAEGVSMRERAEWVEIRLGKSITGWVPRSSIQFVE